MLLGSYLASVHLANHLLAVRLASLAVGGVSMIFLLLRRKFRDPIGYFILGGLVDGLVLVGVAHLIYFAVIR